jgi:hypothetical protein
MKATVELKDVSIMVISGFVLFVSFSASSEWFGLAKKIPRPLSPVLSFSGTCFPMWTHQRSEEHVGRRMGGCVSLRVQNSLMGNLSNIDSAIHRASKFSNPQIEWRTPQIWISMPT